MSKISWKRVKGGNQGGIIVLEGEKWENEKGGEKRGKHLIFS